MSEPSTSGALVVRGRAISAADIDLVRRLIREHGSWGRTRVAHVLAERWDWRQPNGRLKARACADVLQALHARGLIALPEARHRRRRSPAPATVARLDTRPVRGPLRDWLPFRFELLADAQRGAVWKYVMEQYHYLGFRHLVGSTLTYLVYSGERLVAAVGWQAAVQALGCRDRVIGWNAVQRQEHLHRVATNARFLMLPWVEVPHAASHILGRMVRRLSADWATRYGYGLWLLETFVDAARFDGTCYRAANWLRVGRTQGFAKTGAGFVYHGHPKEVYLYVLDPRMRHHIGCAEATDPPLTPEYLLSRVESKSWLERRRFMIVRGDDWDPEVPPRFDLSAEEVRDVAAELEAFHGLFEDAFCRSEQVGWSRCYLQGLLTAIDRKSVEPMALALEGPEAVRNLQRFIGQYKWDDEYLARRHRQEASKALAAADGVLSVDSSEFVKKGRESVGVARQYCGRLGKIDNCQSGVFVAYASAQGYGLIDRRLFMPESWFSEEQRERRAKCKVPEDLTFQTKTELAAQMVREVRATDLFPARWVVGDTVFGNSPAFLQGLPDDLWYLMEIPCTRTAWRGVDGTVAPSTAPRAVSDMASDTDLSWHRVKLAEGAKGPLVAEVARLRMRLAEGKQPGQEQWLFLRRDVATGETKYYVSNAPVETPRQEMTRVCLLRWPIEQCFEEGKSELGMAHYEHRSWPAWHRHMTFVFLAQLFLLQMRQRLKKGLPR